MTWKYGEIHSCSQFCERPECVKARESRNGDADLLKLFLAFESACAAFWQKNLDKQISDRRLRKLDATMQAKRSLFLLKLQSTPVSETAPWQPGDARVVCAACRDADGRIVTGARHFDAVMMEQIRRSPKPNAWRGGEQGFIDQRGNFLTREQAREIAVQQGQILRRVGGDNLDLFSENLY